MFVDGDTARGGGVVDWDVDANGAAAVDVDKSAHED